jgi:hypothetical protein
MQEKRERFKKLIDEKSDKSWKERRAELDRFMARPHGEWEQAIKEIYSKHAKAIGVFSFAGDPRSILMWTHYGNNHQGACVQFALAHDPRVFAMAVSVDYADDYPRIDYAIDLGGQLIKSLTQKHSGWRYEKEWRLIHVNNANRYLRFKPDALTGVTLGCRSSEHVRSTLANESVRSFVCEAYHVI